jgi:hypothetical protein
MFDLESATAEWRQLMQAAGLGAADLLDELESHLRDEIDRQTQSGSSIEEGFQSAVRQIGSPQALRAEFAKAGSPEQGRLRKLAATAYSVELLAYTTLQARLLWNSAPAQTELWLGIAGLAFTLCAAYAGWRLAPRMMHVITNHAMRLSAAIAAILSTVAWIAAYAYFVLPRFEFTPGQFAAAFVWALLPMLVAPTLLVGIDAPERTVG